MSYNPEQLPYNLLPHGGSVHYYGPILGEVEAMQYFQILMDKIAWKHDELLMFGKPITTKRKVAWYGEKAFSYTYSKTTRTAHHWTQELLELKTLVLNHTGINFNACLLNLYHSGEEGMSWHSDDEKPLGPHPIIASLSLGAERKFSLKHKETRERISLPLENGSLLLMKDDTQKNWLHSLPKTKKVKAPRINLTFRQMLD